MAHAEGWIEAYDLLEEGKRVPEDLKKLVLSNRSGLGESMFHWYCIEGQVSVVEQILEFGFDINETNKVGQTPFFECCEISRWKMAAFLLRRGADPEIRNKYDLNIREHFSSSFFGSSKQLTRLEQLLQNHGRGEGK